MFITSDMECFLIKIFFCIYLSIRKKLEHVVYSSVPKVFNGVKNSGVQFDINTLDNYSLRDLKKIRNNLNKLKNSEIDSEYFEKTKNHLTLGRRIGK